MKISVPMKISVVTPSYQQGSYLEQAIHSVLGQNDMNLQYVIVDGGSTDESLSIIEKYKDRLAWWISEKDGGHANAINKGFARTDGEIMGWLNSDDMYFPWTFRLVREIFESFPDIEWITGVPALWNKNDQLSHYYPESNYFNKWDYAGGRYQWIQQESTFWRRSLWDRAGGRVDDSGILMIDGELWKRFFTDAELWRVETLLGGYRVHDTNRAQATMATVEAEMNAFCSEFKDRLTRSEVLRVNEYLKLKNTEISEKIEHDCNRYPLIRWNIHTNCWSKETLYQCHEWPFFAGAPAAENSVVSPQAETGRTKTSMPVGKKKGLSTRIKAFFRKRLKKRTRKNPK